MIGKLFSKKDNKDIESLKKRFSQVSQDDPAAAQPGISAAAAPADPAAPGLGGVPASDSKPAVISAAPIQPAAEPVKPAFEPKPLTPAVTEPAHPLTPQTAEPVKPVAPEPIKPAAPLTPQPVSPPVIDTKPAITGITEPIKPALEEPVRPLAPELPGTFQSTGTFETAQPSPAILNPMEPDVTPAAQPLGQPAQPLTQPETQPAEPVPEGAADFKVVEIIEGSPGMEAVQLGDQPKPDPLLQKQEEKQEIGKMGVRKISKYLDDLKNELDDTKLTSLIIQQVKELIEIDQNLNNKIKDIEDGLRKETKEREKLQSQIDKHYEEFKKGEKNMDKFIALYEVVTNQFNPFVEGAPEMLKPTDAQPDIPSLPKIEESPEIKPAMPFKASETTAEDVPKDFPPPKSVNFVSGVPLKEGDLPPDLHFETKDGQKISTLGELIEMLKGMSSDVFSHHVTDAGNDFAAWVHHVLKNESLAGELGPMKNRVDMINSIMKHI